MLIQHVARQAGLSPRDSRRVACAAVLHDIGKFAVPMEILQKSTPLSPEEFALIKTHAQVGYNILMTPGSSVMRLAASIAQHHHERYDGSGYPAGLAGEAIELPAQIAAICDSYDALRQDRPYRRGLSHDDAMRVIVEGDGRTMPAHFAPRVWAAFQQASDYARLVFEAVPAASMWG